MTLRRISYEHPAKVEGARLTDEEALARMNSTTRAAIKKYGFVRCLRAPNAWHRAIPLNMHGLPACDCQKPVRVKP